MLDMAKLPTKALDIMLGIVLVLAALGCLALIGVMLWCGTLT